MIDPATIVQSIKAFWNKKASTGLVITLTFFTLIIAYGPEWIKLFQKSNASPLPESPQQQEEKPKGVVMAEESVCSQLIPLDQKNISTDYEHIRIKDNYLSPTGSGNTWEGTLWIKEIVKPKFKKIFVEYEVISSNNDKPPSLIFSLSRTNGDSKRQNIVKIWIPEFSESDNIKIAQIIGYAKNVNFESNDLSRETPIELPDAVRPKQLDSFSIEPTQFNGNEMMSNFMYNYTSDRTGIAFPYSFNRKITFPFSNLSSSNELLDIGVGTYTGNNLRIVSLEICY